MLVPCSQNAMTTGPYIAIPPLLKSTLYAYIIQNPCAPGTFCPFGGLYQFW